MCASCVHARNKEVIPFYIGVVGQDINNNHTVLVCGSRVVVGRRGVIHSDNGNVNVRIICDTRIVSYYIIKAILTVEIPGWIVNEVSIFRKERNRSSLFTKKVTVAHTPQVAVRILVVCQHPFGNILRQQSILIRRVIIVIRHRWIRDVIHLELHHSWPRILHAIVNTISEIVTFPAPIPVRRWDVDERTITAQSIRIRRTVLIAGLLKLSSQLGHIQEVGRQRLSAVPSIGVVGQDAHWQHRVITRINIQDSILIHLVDVFVRDWRSVEDRESL